MQDQGKRTVWTGAHSQRRPLENEVVAEGYGRMSYVLFRNDHPEREVIASRSPDAAFAVGSALAADPLLDAEAVEYLNRTGGEREPLVVFGDLGVGLLSKVYDGCAALGLYLHLHLPPEPVSRLINSGVLEGQGEDGRPARNARMRSCGDGVSQEDVTYYVPLAAWWDDSRRRLIETSPQRHYRIHSRVLSDAICRMAAFVGCGVTLSTPDAWGGGGRELTCYNPALVEACLLFLLSEVRERAATRSTEMTLESVSGEAGGGLRVVLRYAVIGEDAACAPTPTAGFSHMTQVAELCGLELYSIFSDGRSDEEGERETLYDCTVVLEWLRDPTTLPTSDLKARLRLIYND